MDDLPPVGSKARTLDVCHVRAAASDFACPDFAIRHYGSLDTANVLRLELDGAPVPDFAANVGHVSRQPAGGHPRPEDAASVRASKQSIAALGAPEEGAQIVDARRSTASNAAARVSKSGAEVARGSMMSTGAVDIAAGPP